MPKLRQGWNAWSEKLAVHTGQKCEACGLDLWAPCGGHLRCRCGRWCWIERRREGAGKTAGARFRYRQGEHVPKSAKGWMVTTA